MFPGYLLSYEPLFEIILIAKRGFAVTAPFADLDPMTFGGGSLQLIRLPLFQSSTELIYHVPYG